MHLSPIELSDKSRGFVVKYAIG